MGADLQRDVGHRHLERREALQEEDHLHTHVLVMNDVVATYSEKALSRVPSCRKHLQELNLRIK